MDQVATGKVADQLQKLTSLHEETGELIGRITKELGDLGRINQSLREELLAGE
jgi:hypothetical protein